MLAFRKRFAIAKPCFPLLFPRERTTSVETVSQHKILLNCRSVKVPPELFSFSSRCTIFHAKWWHHHHVNFTSRPSWQQGLVFPSSKLLPASPTQFPRLSLLSCSSANDDDREHDPYLCWWLSSLAILVSFELVQTNLIVSAGSNNTYFAGKSFIQELGTQVCLHIIRTQLKFNLIQMFNNQPHH